MSILKKKVNWTRKAHDSAVAGTCTVVPIAQRGAGIVGSWQLLLCFHGARCLPLPRSPAGIPAPVWRPRISQTQNCFVPPPCCRSSPPMYWPGLPVSSTHWQCRPLPCVHFKECIRSEQIVFYEYKVKMRCF